MNENQKTSETRLQSNRNCDADLKERSAEDRRKQPGEGFVRIGTVGWICRRERTRREGDEFKWD